MCDCPCLSVHPARTVQQSMLRSRQCAPLTATHFKNYRMYHSMTVLIIDKIFMSHIPCKQAYTPEWVWNKAGYVSLWYIYKVSFIICITSTCHNLVLQGRQTLAPISVKLDSYFLTPSTRVCPTLGNSEGQNWATQLVLNYKYEPTRVCARKLPWRLHPLVERDPRKRIWLDGISTPVLKVQLAWTLGRTYARMRT